jgi:hypothetical protein
MALSPAQPLSPKMKISSPRCSPSRPLGHARVVVSGRPGRVRASELYACVQAVRTVRAAAKMPLSRSCVNITRVVIESLDLHPRVRVCVACRERGHLQMMPAPMPKTADAGMSITQSGCRLAAARTHVHHNHVSLGIEDGGVCVSVRVLWSCGGVNVHSSTPSSQARHCRNSGKWRQLSGEEGGNVREEGFGRYEVSLQ